MSLCLGAHSAHSKGKISFVNRSPWFISPRDLDGVFAVFYVKNKRDKRPRRKKAEADEYLKLISWYEAILNRKSNAASKISNMKRIELIAKLLELIII